MRTLALGAVTGTLAAWLLAAFGGPVPSTHLAQQLGLGSGYLLAAILGGLLWLAPAFDVAEAIATFFAVQAKGIGLEFRKLNNGKFSAAGSLDGVHLICEGLGRPCGSGPQFWH